MAFSQEHGKDRRAFRDRRLAAPEREVTGIAARSQGPCNHLPESPMRDCARRPSVRHPAIAGPRRGFVVLARRIDRSGARCDYHPKLPTATRRVTKPASQLMAHAYQRLQFSGSSTEQLRRPLLAPTFSSICPHRSRKLRKGKPQPRPQESEAYSACILCLTWGGRSMVG